MSNPFANVRPTVAALFGLVLFIIVSGFIYDTARRTGRAEGEQEQLQSEMRAQAVAIGRCKPASDSLACIHQVKEKQMDTSREEAAVRWQREAAQSAWWAVALSVLQGLVGVAGLIAVLRSLRHSDDALNEARSANIIAREASEGELRAWVEIDFEFQSLVSVASRPYISGKTVLKNLGATPAVDVSYYLGLSYEDKLNSELENAITDFVSGELDWSDEMLFPGASVTREASTEHTGRPPPPGTLHVFMVAAYTTVFSQKVRITARAWDLRTPYDESGYIDIKHPPRLSSLIITPSRIARARAT